MYYVVYEHVHKHVCKHEITSMFANMFTNLRFVAPRPEPSPPNMLASTFTNICLGMSANTFANTLTNMSSGILYIPP